MSPTQERVRLPEGWQVAHREAHDTTQDERPVLRDAEGHVLAEVEQWLPYGAN